MVPVEGVAVIPSPASVASFDTRSVVPHFEPDASATVYGTVIVPPAAAVPVC